MAHPKTPGTAQSDDSPRFAQERQARIAATLREQGRVEVSALAAEYGLSEDTIRRDLRLLASRGLVQKTHGGAVALYTTAASLIVAVPATMLFNMLNARANRFVARVASAGDELIERLQILHGEGVRPRRGMAMAAGAEADVADERELDAEADAPPPRPASRRPGARPPQSRT